jgi:predicted SnoaL-like aldol condensation-catalyzing enzyme
VKVEGLIAVRSSFVAEADFLMVDGRLTDIGQPAAWVVLGIFRLDNGRLAEHWDVIEDEATRATSISRLPMFGATFPS